MSEATDEAWEAGSAHGYELGQIVGLEWAEGHLRGIAAALFTHGKDDEAKATRAFADEIGTERGKRRTAFDEKYHAGDARLVDRRPE